MQTFETAHGEYGILHAPDGALAPEAVERFRRAAACGDAMLYADHAVRFHNGREKRVIKPDWSPDTLLSMNYIESPIAVRRALLPQGGEEAFRSPENRYALTLLLTERAKSVLHVHETLFTAGAEPPCESPAPIRHALRRRRIPGNVEKGRLKGSFAVRYPIPVDTRVSCVVYGGGDARLVRKTMESFAIRCCWPHVELIIADNGEIETQKERYYAALEQRDAAYVIRDSESRGMSCLVNLAAFQSTGDVLLFLPAGWRLDAYDAVERMLELALRPHAGAVGGVCSRGSGDVIHDVKAVDGVLMVQKARFFACGCFDETLSEAGFLRAYSLLNGDRRLYNIVTPYARFHSAPENADVRISQTNRMRIRDMESFENTTVSSYSL